MKNELILFETADKEIKLNVSVKDSTVWLNRNQLAELFERDVKTIGKHINNALKEELDNSVVAKFATTASDGKIYQVEHYNLDMIISVGYRVKSNRGVEFRKWANKVLKQYIIQGYAINEKRLEALQRTVSIQTKMLASTLEVEEIDVLKAVNLYTEALMLLDQYDHQSLNKPEGSKPIYRITYEECRRMVEVMEDTFHSDVFGIEKEEGKVEGILAAVYQSVFGGDVYPSLEEKAANLLYFMIKDHPYADGCKRIAASLFLEFLNKNNFLYKDGTKRISDGAMVAITLMIAESNPSEKDIMVNLVMNLLTI
ncbi:RhuM family protein [Blautia wexlerae]|uniref:RhuM family protein n=1 Tax=Blautia wexlerae TaxID=418240 RepID=UPI0035BEA80A